ncbi:MAG: MATE family efflux transporter [Oscillospiraceae bacterium]|nr:MATE family efflux transporter [Oscillospiraceae bacterium]
MSNTLENNFTEGSVLKTMVKFAWPLFLANMLTTFYNVVDTLIIGMFDGSVGISAVTTGGQILNLLTTVGMGFSNGGQILISQLKGARDQKSLNSAIGSLLTLCTIIGLLLSVVGLFGTQLGLRLLNTPAEALEGATDYMQITSIGLVFMFLNLALSAIMRGLGDSKRPLLFTAISAGINVVLDFLFVGPLHMGAFGAGLATMLAIVCSVLFALVYLYRRREHFSFDFKRRSFLLLPRWLKEYLRLGIPLALQSSVINLTLSYVLSLVNVYGVAASSAVGIGGKLINVCCMPYFAVSTAAGSICGQCVGAGKLDRVKKTIDTTMLINFCITAVTTVVIVFCPDPIIHLFDKNPEVVDICRLYLRLHIIHNASMAIFSSHGAACTGVGNTTLSAIAYLTDGVFLRLTLCLLFTRVFDMGLFGIIFATAVAPVGADIIFATYYWGGFWRKAGKRRYEMLNAAAESTAAPEPAE